MIGAGSWGTTVAAIVGEHAPDDAVGRDADLVAEIDEQHENPRYLGGIALPDALRATVDLEEACAGADVVVLAVPSHGFRAVLERAAPLDPAPTCRSSAWPRASSRERCGA